MTIHIFIIVTFCSPYLLSNTDSIGSAFALPYSIHINNVTVVLPKLWYSYIFVLYLKVAMTSKIFILLNEALVVLRVAGLKCK